MEHNLKYLPIIVILSAFSLLVYFEYNNLPIRPDELWYVLNVENPEKSSKLFFRFFHFYMAKIVYLFFPTALVAAAVTSFINSIGIILTSYFLIKKLSNNTSAIIGSMLVATYPTLLYQSTWFGSDIACLFYGLLAIFFSVKVYLNDKNKFSSSILSAFFLIGAIYSKQSGICFIFPILLLLWPGRNKNIYVGFSIGIFGAYLFISILNGIWLNDFFYHINPNSYFDFLNRFNTQLVRDFVVINKWSPTFIRQIIDYSPWIIVYICALTMLFFLRLKHNKYHSYVVFCIFFAGGMSFLIHEIVHVFYVGLNIHFRYMLSMIIPALIAFSILLPINERQAIEYKEGVLSVNLLLSIVFAISIFFLTKDTYYQALNQSWELESRLINVFSFWFFLLGFGFIFYDSNKIIMLKKIIPLLSLNVIGYMMIISYSGLWANIQSKDLSHRAVEQRTVSYERFKKNHGLIADRLLIANLEPTRNMQNYFEYIYLDGEITRTNYMEIIKQEFSKDKKIINEMDEIKYNKYQYLLTHYDMETLKKRALGYNLKFNIKTTDHFSVYFGNTLYEIIHTTP